MPHSPSYDPNAFAPHILYSDNHLLAANKPAGMLAQDSGTGLFNLEDWAREWVRVEKKKTGRAFLQAVHRIDRPVSGVVLFARTSKALTRLHQAIRDRACQKIYHALVKNSPQKPAMKLEHWILHEHRRGIICDQKVPHAKRAILRYKILKKLPQSTLLEIYLETGRYHQIRPQLAAIGCPIIGDVRYQSDAPAPAPSAIALHHHCLQIEHPVRREPLKIEAPDPSYFQE
jgi:23S rRNA pseudouridine1911/1915/1917 synthase